MTKIVAAGPRLYAIKGGAVFLYSRSALDWRGDFVAGPGVTPLVDIAVTWCPAPDEAFSDSYEVFVVDQTGQIWRQEQTHGMPWVRVYSP